MRDLFILNNAEYVLANAKVRQTCPRLFSVAVGDLVALLFPGWFVFVSCVFSCRLAVISIVAGGVASRRVFALLVWEL